MEDIHTDNGEELDQQTADSEKPIETDNTEVEEQEETAQTEETAEQKIENLTATLEKEKKEYLFLMAEFDNFRKRTIKEKSELIRNASESVLKDLLPVVDDFERGLKANGETDDAPTIREGMELIYHKLMKCIEKNGVKAIDPDDTTFDTDRHEAISAIPVTDENLKGQILDTVEKGYMLNDKVLRHAKVVVGQ